MVVPVLILTLSLIGVAVALMLPGYGDLILLAGPCTIAALILLLRALVQRITAPPAPEPEPNRILIDGSNVMYWRDAARGHRHSAPDGVCTGRRL
jgi:hypothetical protein